MLNQAATLKSSARPIIKGSIGASSLLFSLPFLHSWMVQARNRWHWKKELDEIELIDELMQVFHKHISPRKETKTFVW
jgi:hypothetical protein